MQNAEPKLDSLANSAATEDLSGGFMNPLKKRGRPKGSTKPAQASAPQNPTSPGINPLDPQLNMRLENNKKLLKPVVGIMSNLGEKLCEDKAGAIQPTESEMIIEAGAQCLEQYMPDVMGKHASLIVLLFATGSWGTRVYLIRQQKIAEYRAQAAAAKQANVQPPKENLREASAFN